MNKQEREAICLLLSKHTAKSYFYYSNLSDKRLLKALQGFKGQMVNNSAGEVNETD
ncbi:hypothetical protein [Paraliobacillus sediminis]|uniref:hypothetical protein n=1 Tax=Paraliobacillus sediminis TaxID=1885916 RepID=UPI0013C29F1A|nr:hypothetical protein [Paraliobacillus sediminis]